jgi:hypothetical protein
METKWIVAGLFGMTEQSASDRLPRAGTHALDAVTQILVTTVILAVFAGMGFLVYTGRMSSDPLILLAGLVVGYLGRVGQELF